MLEDTNIADLDGEVRGQPASEVRDTANSRQNTSSTTGNMAPQNAPQNPPFEILSPQPTSTVAGPHPLAATVEDCVDEGDQLFPQSPSKQETLLTSPTVVSPSVTSPSVISPYSTHTTTSAATNLSGSSASSGNTVSRAPLDNLATGSMPDAGHFQTPRHQNHPGALSYLDSDSPEMNQDVIQEASRWKRRVPNQVSPSMRSPSSSVPSHHTDVFSEYPPDGNSFGSWSPEQPAQDESPGFIKLNGNHQPAYPHPQQPPFPGPFGSPEMGRGNAHVPHFPPGSMPQRFPGPDQFGLPPRMESMPPLSGYQLVAAKLAGLAHGPPVRPVYRRFGALNHRILLHLQDEISELEGHLQTLDMADTRDRMPQGSIYPASRRQEALRGGDFLARKTDILGSIGYKLHQYNQVMASFEDTQKFHPPSMPDIHDYKSFLASTCAVVEDETRFLNAVDDLVSLTRAPVPPHHPHDLMSEDVLTPMPRPPGDAGFPPGRPQSASSAYSTTWKSSLPPAERTVPATVAQLALAMAVALLVPILTFAVIPGFAARMTVVLLVGMGVCTAMLQSGLLKFLSSERGYLDCILYVGVYGGVMAVVAGTFS